MAKVIATKISDEAAEAFERISARRGMNPFRVVQDLIYVYLRMCSGSMEMSDVLYRHYAKWFNINVCNNIANLTILEQKNLNIVEVLAIVQEKGKKNKSICAIAPTFFDRPTITFNEVQIISRVLESVMPGLYRTLDAIKEENGHADICDTLNWLVDQYGSDIITREVEELFSDNERGEWGQQRTDTHYVRHNSKSMSSKQYVLDLFNEQG